MKMAELLHLKVYPFTYTAKVLKMNVAIKDDFMFLISVSKMAKLAFFGIKIF